MNKMPGFTAESSLCKTSGHYSMIIGTFSQADVAIHPALLPPTGNGPVGWQLCVDKCTPKCVKDKKCNNKPTAAAKAKCKIDCEKKCINDCTGAGGTGTPTELTCAWLSGRWWSCNIGIPAWTAACLLDGGGFACKILADKMKDDSHCEVC